MLSTEIIENFIENQLVEGQLDRTGGLAPKTVIDLLAIVKSTIGYAQYKGFPVICNLSRLSVKRKDKEMRVLTPSERESLIGILMEDMDSFKFGVFLALYTGIRIGELCALQWKDIDFARASYAYFKDYYHELQTACQNVDMILETEHTQQHSRTQPKRRHEPSL